MFVGNISGNKNYKKHNGGFRYLILFFDRNDDDFNCEPVFITTRDENPLKISFLDFKDH